MKCSQLLIQFLLFTVIYSAELSVIEFQYNIFKTILFSKSQKNVIVSPLAIHQLISLISNGALGSTQNQMSQSLKSKSVIELNKENTKIHTLLYTNTTLYNNFIIANGIFSKFAPKKQFIDQVIMRYNATIEQLVNDNQINSWCKTRTRGRIKDIVSFTEKMSLLLLSGVTFQAKWKFPFKEYLTTKEKFNANETVDMMHIKFSNVSYYENENVKIIELPLENNIKSVVILPAEDIQIDIFLANLSNNIIKEYLSLLTEQAVLFSFPRFELGNDIVLNEMMKTLGMEDAFDEEKAKFSTISEEGKIFISRIKHMTYIKVKEKGIDIDSLSVSPFAGANKKEEKIKQMNVNRPFFFGITHSELGDMFLFMCKIEQIN